ncbi:hypothetical protein BDV95DRAFT_601035 [Massariosphaeria phaeospora]|uniref:Extracellular membrane protein CFEM domain-containing protein n=1 Tax=Massariosphaeria phaeospora TaxID=100035 RepID=A0A7C8MH54_9PLEO|nr:hypothetical protein BDV95DRAFT_601035 [Massariosphaeria phaeospora]
MLSNTYFVLFSLLVTTSNAVCCKNSGAWWCITGTDCDPNCLDGHSFCDFEVETCLNDSWGGCKKLTPRPETPEEVPEETPTPVAPEETPTPVAPEETPQPPPVVTEVATAVVTVPAAPPPVVTVSAAPPLVVTVSQAPPSIVTVAAAPSVPPPPPAAPSVPGPSPDGTQPPAAQPSTIVITTPAPANGANRVEAPFILVLLGQLLLL